MLTKDQFIAANRHEWDGIILDACMTHRTGAELSVWLRTLRARVEARLGQMYDALIRENEKAK